jgi:uncharacterized protein
MCQVQLSGEPQNILPNGFILHTLNAVKLATIAIDATLRTYDKDGRLHIARSHISKACVNPYYGREIPRSQALGLDPNRIYMMLRAPDELAKAAHTFARLPILAKHTPISNFDSLDEKEKKKYIVGTIGSDVEFLDPFLDADVSIWDADAIAGIETEQQCEFSCGYSYEPIMTTGNYAGENYDGIMTQIQGNHLALVESGRAGPEVRAADSKIEEKTPMIRSKLGNALIVAVTTAFPKVQIAADSELEKALAPATRKTFGTAQRQAASKLIIAMDSSIDEKQVFAVMDALSDVDDPEPKKKDNEDPEPAKDKRKGKDGKAHDSDCDCKDCKAGRDAAAEEEAEKKRADDKKAKDEEELKAGKAMDAKLEALRAEFREADQAKREVRPIVGDVVAMDSAEKIYEFALDQMKVDHAGVTGTAALRALFNLAKDRTIGTVPAVAMDSATTFKRFPNMGRIRQA